MKITIFLFLMAISLSLNAFDSFCEGFEAGYLAVDPYGLAPLCPLVPLGMEATYKNGYILGVQVASR